MATTPPYVLASRAFAWLQVDCGHDIDDGHAYDVRARQRSAWGALGHRLEAGRVQLGRRAGLQRGGRRDRLYGRAGSESELTRSGLSAGISASKHDQNEDVQRVKRVGEAGPEIRIYRVRAVLEGAGPGSVSTWGRPATVGG